MTSTSRTTTPGTTTPGTTTPGTTTSETVTPAGRRALLVTLGVLGAVPVASGTAGVLLGPAGAPGGAPTVSSVDSEYRFVNVFWLAAGLVLWWSLRQPERRSTVTRLVLALAASGGGPRLLSWARTGAPHPVFRAALVLELVVVPVVLGWHARVFGAGVRSARGRS